MADPLSIAASVVGLLTAAIQVSQALAKVIRKARHAPEDCRRLKAEVDDIRNILGQLQLFVLKVNTASRSRTSLLMVDQVVATLSSCVLTFSDLQVFVDGLQSEANMGVLDRMRWMSKETELKVTLSRLETHKSSLTLMLTILTCQLQIDAENKVDRLCILIEQILLANPMLAGRLETFDAEGADTYTAKTRQGDELGVTAMHQMSISTGAENEADPIAELSDYGQGVKRDARGFAFEELLLNSRAYRNAAHNNSDAFSIVSSAGRTASWSMLSGLSLSEMSNIAILALPIYASDLNNKEVYDFEPAREEPNLPSELPSSPSSSAQSTAKKTSLKNWWKGFANKPPAVGEDTVISNPPVVFGRPLSQSIRSANAAISLTNEQGESFIYGYVPIVIAKIGVFLKEKGTDVDNIFKLSGNPARIMHLQEAFENPPRYGKGLTWTGYTVFDAAGTMLRFLKSLPEPIIPYDHYANFTGPLRAFLARQDQSGAVFELNIDEHAEIVATVQRQITELPPLSRQLLLYMLDILAVFASKSDVNHMTALRLSEVFHPAFLSRRPAEMDSFEHRLAVDTTIFLLENQDNFLIGM